MLTESCCLCDVEIVGHGHNPAPLGLGRCCDVCNETKVVPARIALLRDKAYGDLLEEAECLLAEAQDLIDESEATDEPTGGASPA